MDQIVEQLININRKDCLDIIGILLPIILTMVIIFQNRIYSRRTDKQCHLVKPVSTDFQRFQISETAVLMLRKT